MSLADRAFYNEIDPGAAAWLRELIAEGHIAPGIVDERDIRDIRPDELRDFDQCHFFAGIGGWSLALRMAGWPDDRPVWTGSCPCQPFSTAGKGLGFDDERHLWPHWFHLIGECAPAIVLGEQVAGPDGLAWLDLVSADMEGSGYAIGAADLCVAGIGGPHIRQRLWFGAERLADANDAGPQGWREPGRERAAERTAGTGGVAGGVADTASNGWREERADAGGGAVRNRAQGWRAGLGSGCGDQRPGPLHGFWRDADWLGCRDGKWRPVEPGTFPLAHGIPGRVGLLRGYGNAISPPVAAEFIEAWEKARMSAPVQPADLFGWAAQ